MAVGTYRKDNRNIILNACWNEISRCGHTVAFIKKICEVNKGSILLHKKEKNCDNTDINLIINNTYNLYSFTIGNGITGHTWILMKINNKYIFISSYVCEYVFLQKVITERDIFHQLKICDDFIKSPSEELWKILTDVDAPIDFSGTIVENYKYEFIIKGYNTSSQFINDSKGTIDKFLLSLKDKSFEILEKDIGDDNNGTFKYFITGNVDNKNYINVIKEL